VLGGICGLTSGDFLGGLGGWFTKLAFVGFENFLEGNGGDCTKLAFTVPENFLEGIGGGGFTKAAFIACDSRGDGSGIA
jgi:hypothetical protein